MKNKTEKLLALLDGQPVIPVLKIGDVAHAVPLARALVAGGLPAIEITLRTPAALDAIRAVAKEVPEAVVGAGTILSGEDFVKAADAGSRFIVSPGSTPQLLETAEKSDVPLLPGATTPSEIMVLQARGYEILKFFPAEQSGGLPFLKALASPLAAIRFCPTGGISLKNAPNYLAQPNIVCVGGSWVAPDADIEAGNWQRIEELAREASQLKKR
jgi:2-dehydro-3-deoxyphosphogluconate aldolase/(4S)-4-hydroxy-2-oxoglutarate aldolase